MQSETQYADDSKLRARQRLWAAEQNQLDLVGWTFEQAGVAPGQRVLDVGCGNGAYLRRLTELGIEATGCDLSMGMLPIGKHDQLVNADAMQLPFRDDAFDVVLAPHMLYHVPDVATAAHEMRRVLRRDGVCVAVTNGKRHTRALFDAVEASVRVRDRQWEMRTPDQRRFSLENGRDRLAAAFADVVCVRPERSPHVELTDAALAADYVASVGDAYEHEIATPWSDVVDAVRVHVQGVIDRDGYFAVDGDPGAFICRG